MPIFMKYGENYNREDLARESGIESLASGPGDESPVGSGPGDETPVSSGPGDERPEETIVVEKTELTDDGFAIDSFAAPVDPSDPSDGLLPTESLRPIESFYPVDPSDPSAELTVAETTQAGGDVGVETITLVHEGFELLI
jgi:hypothetical protein